MYQWQESFSILSLGHIICIVHRYDYSYKVQKEKNLNGSKEKRREEEKKRFSLQFAVVGEKPKIYVISERSDEENWKRQKNKI